MVLQHRAGLATLSDPAASAACSPPRRAMQARHGGGARAFSTEKEVSNRCRRCAVRAQQACKACTAWVVCSRAAGDALHLGLPHVLVADEMRQHHIILLRRQVALRREGRGRHSSHSLSCRGTKLAGLLVQFWAAGSVRAAPEPLRNNLPDAPLPTGDSRGAMSECRRTLPFRPIP